MGYSKLQRRIRGSLNHSVGRNKKLAVTTPNIRVGKKRSSGNMPSSKPVEKSDEE